MKTFGKRLLLAAWILAATFTIAHLWLTYPDIPPHLPPDFTLWMIDLYGASNGEELRDLETLTALAMALPIALMLTLAGRVLWRRSHR